MQQWSSGSDHRRAARPSCLPDLHHHGVAPPHPMQSQHRTHIPIYRQRLSGSQADSIHTKHDKTVAPVSRLAWWCELDNCHKHLQTSNFRWKQPWLVEYPIHTTEEERKTWHRQDSFVGSGLVVWIGLKNIKTPHTTYAYHTGSWVTDSVVVLRPTRNKIGHFGDVSPSQSLGLAWKKLNSTEQKHTFTNQ